LKEAQSIFRNKIKFAYDRLPEQVKEQVYPVHESKTELVLSNGSRIQVGTSMRGDTLQWLLITEFGKICAKYPEKAREIITGALNTVHVGQRHHRVDGRRAGGPVLRNGHDRREHGAGGPRALAARLQVPLLSVVARPEEPARPGHVPMPESMERYFKELEKANPHIRLDAAQRAWYVKKAETQGADMKREHPSTPKESFEGAVEGAIYANQMALAARARAHARRCRSTRPSPSTPFGISGATTRTRSGSTNTSRPSTASSATTRTRTRIWRTTSATSRTSSRARYGGTHYLPHDAENENLERGENRVDRLEELKLPGEIVVVERIEDVMVGIELTRKMLPRAFFDRAGCDKGIKALDNYKFEFDEKHGCWRNKPAHTWASNGADAIRQWAQGWSPREVNGWGRGTVRDGVGS
jgi:hypothetical protein